jgi:hypothetical protein
MKILVFVILLVVLFICYIGKSPVYHTNKSYYRNKSSSYYTNKSSYEYLLNDNRWKEKRKEILERDNYTCQCCGNKSNLNVHHKYYVKYPNGCRADPWNYPNKALITLCENCHKKAHQKYKVKTYYRSYYDSNI